MLFSFLALLTFVALVYGSAAPRNQDSPRGVVYTARFDKTIFGAVLFYTYNGYVKVHVNLKNLPSKGGPFLYHIHLLPVPPGGDCYATLGHLDPYKGDPNAKTWALAEVGDLSHKHGKIPSTSFKQTYFDPYLSLNPNNKAFFGGRSVVVHLADMTRIACANIYEVGATEASQFIAQVEGLDGKKELSDERCKEENVDVDVIPASGEVMDSKVDSGVDVDAGVDFGKDVDVDLPLASGIRRVRA